MIEQTRNRMQTTAAAARAALRRWLRPATLLLVVVIFALAEPLICIIHCQLAMPAQAHQHHNHSAMAHAHAAAGGAHLQPGSAAFEAQSGVGTSWCFANLSPADSAPDQFVPASPVHEVVLAAASALLPFLVSFWLAAHPAPALRGRATIPPTPPPRHQAFA